MSETANYTQKLPIPKHHKQRKQGNKTQRFDKTHQTWTLTLISQKNQLISGRRKVCRNIGTNLFRFAKGVIPLKVKSQEKYFTDFSFQAHRHFFTYKDFLFLSKHHQAVLI